MSKTKKTFDELLEEALLPIKDHPNDIPSNWEYVKLGSVITLVSGRDLSSRLCNNESKGIPYIMGASNIKDNDLSIERWIEEPTVVGLKEDILITVKGTVGKIIILEHEEVHLSRQVMAIRSKNIIDNRFLYFYILTYIRKLKELAKGIIPGISRDDILNAPFPLLPLNEQKRIAEKVERLLGKLDEAKRLIDEAKETFELRRAAIFDKAFRGELTKKWREDNQHILSSTDYLKYLSCEEVDLKDNQIFKLPSNWIWTNLGNLSTLITKGASPKWQGINYTNNEEDVLFITSENVRDGFIDISKKKYVEKEFNNKQKRSILNKGDLLLNIVGASIGRAAIFNKDANANINQAVSLIRLNDFKLTKYISYYLNSHIASNYYNNKKVDVARANLSLKDVANIPVPFPPLDELIEITKIIETNEDKENLLTYTLNMNENINILKQSILSKAFRGELGTNDSSDESAIELLKSVLQEVLS